MPLSRAVLSHLLDLVVAGLDSRARLGRGVHATNELANLALGLLELASGLPMDVTQSGRHDNHHLLVPGCSRLTRTASDRPSGQFECCRSALYGCCCPPSCVSLPKYFQSFSFNQLNYYRRVFFDVWRQTRQVYGRVRSTSRMGRLRKWSAPSALMNFHRVRGQPGVRLSMGMRCLAVVV